VLQSEDSDAFEGKRRYGVLAGRNVVC